MLRAGASTDLAEPVRLGADAELERRADASELRASATASLAVPGGTASVTVRTRRLVRDGAEDASVTDTVLGYTLGF